MEDKHIMEVANGINEVLNMSARITMSWGISDRRATQYAGKPAMLFKVNGFVHQGDVVVALNEGQDLYECYLLEENCRVKSFVKEVYVDNLVEILDKVIETGDMTEEEYRQRAAEWLVSTAM